MFKPKKYLIDKDESTEKKVEVEAPDTSDLQINIGKSNKKHFEKSEILFRDYRIYTFRPGGIKVFRISDEKRLVQIVDNFKVKYYNGGQKVVEVKITKMELPTTPEEIESSMKQLGDLLTGKRKLLDKLERAKFDKDKHKLELFVEGRKILHWEGRYVPKHKAFFYQVLTGNFIPFHFYIKMRARPAIALNMGEFNKKIDKAVRKAKEKLAEEFDITMDQIDDIINKKIDEELGKAVDAEVEKAVSATVAEAIADSVGEAMAAGLVDAIEQATGEAIDDALEAELAAAIDAEIAAAVEQGIEEAAVTAGWQAYFDTLAKGGTEAEASANAYEACGAACDNY